MDMAASVWRGRITFGLVSIPVRLVNEAATINHTARNNITEFAGMGFHRIGNAMMQPGSPLQMKIWQLRLIGDRDQADDHSGLRDGELLAESDVSRQS